MAINPSYEYQKYIFKAKNAKTDQEYQEYLSIAIHFLQKMDESNKQVAAWTISKHSWAAINNKKTYILA